MTPQDHATLEDLEFKLQRTKARYELYRTSILEERIERLEEAIAFVKREPNVKVQREWWVFPKESNDERC